MHRSPCLAFCLLAKLSSQFSYIWPEKRSSLSFSFSIVKQIVFVWWRVTFASLTVLFLAPLWHTYHNSLGKLTFFWKKMYLENLIITFKNHYLPLPGAQRTQFGPLHLFVIHFIWSCMHALVPKVTSSIQILELKFCLKFSSVVNSTH